MAFKYTLFLLLFSTVLFSCGEDNERSVGASPSDDNKQVVTALEENAFDIMSYNMYNLFDTLHDEGKEDWQYLPLDHPLKKECGSISNEYYAKLCQEMDWTVDKLKLKLKQIKKGILSSHGRMPTLLAVQEVENENVLKLLAAELGYENIAISDGPDKRGIDVGLLWNEGLLVKTNVIEHQVKKGTLFEKKPTRPILEVQFKVKDIYDLSVFVNHWPSQSNSAEKRVVAAQILQDLIKKREARNPHHLVIATGDFNTIDTDFPHPFLTVTMAGNKGLLDTSDLFYQSNAPREIKDSLPLGTYFYPPKMSWDKLDRIFINKNLFNKQDLEVRPNTYRIGFSGISTTYTYNDKRYFEYGTVVNRNPWRYNFNSTSTADAGYSDHYPVMVEFIVK